MNEEITKLQEQVDGLVEVSEGNYGCIQDDLTKLRVRILDLETEVRWLKGVLAPIIKDEEMKRMIDSHWNERIKDPAFSGDC